MRDPRELVEAKLRGEALEPADLARWIEGYVAGEVSDPQAAALLAGVVARGMDGAELLAWTRAMVDSGARLEWPHDGRPVVDKHSTGGVGDKVSLPLAPALAACGCRVPMISGRGLGHTGGTLDKLEALPGLTTELSLTALRRQVDEVGVAIAAQTDELVPADKRLYALRDHTGLVACRPLIASSILSKKIAEGLDALVLDVKFGSGAFLADPAEGAALAEAMVALARDAGLACRVLQTAMDRPLGHAVGHALEVRETLACLEGEGPADLRELVVETGAELLAMTGLADSLDAGRARIAAALDDGSARERFEALVRAQGGDPAAALPAVPDREVLTAPRPGRLVFGDVRAVGRAVAVLGGGRRLPSDVIDPAVGVRLLRDSGAMLEAGEPWAEVHHRAARGLDEARQLLEAALDLNGASLEPLLGRRF